MPAKAPPTSWKKADGAVQNLLGRQRDVATDDHDAECLRHEAAPEEEETRREPGGSRRLALFPKQAVQLRALAIVRDKAVVLGDAVADAHQFDLLIT